jgi:DNA-binding NtrC family response regulator
MTMSVAGEGEAKPVALARVTTRVLVVDDEPALRRGVARMLLGKGMDVITAEGSGAAMELLERERIDVALVDLMTPTVDGLKLLEHIKARYPEVEVVMMASFGDVETALKAVRAGAYHFLTKPFRSNDEVALTVAKAAEHRQLADRAVMLERRLEQRENAGELIGNSLRMREVYRLAMGVATTSSTVLILGESGTGKELVARAIHQRSPRGSRPFVIVSCSAIPAELLEGELFGHVRGAGATMTRQGLFEAADGGTIFLDDVGDLPLLTQAKLLRVLQDGEVKRLGSNDARNVDVRVIAATHVDLRSRIQAGTFREDLFYRLNVVALELPPLRMRRDDVPSLAYHFLRRYAGKTGREVRNISPEAMQLLRAQQWPGNVRELENAIEHAVVFCRDDTITASDLPFARVSGAEAPAAADAGPPPLALPANLVDLPYRDAKQRAVAAFDNTYFSVLLRRSEGNVSEAARQAGLDRSNFRRAAKRAGVVSRG